MLDIDKIQPILDACPVEYYLSANDNVVSAWPWRMQPPHEASQRYRDVSEGYIVDSAPLRDDIGNRDVVEAGIEMDATAIILEDIYEDCEGTIDSVREGLDLVDDLGYGGEVIAPLQRPYDRCYEALAGETDWYALGGLKDSSGHERVRELRAFHRLAPDVRVHGLGWGVDAPLAAAVRDCPALLFSADSRSANAAGLASEVWSGDSPSTPIGIYTLGHLVETCRRLTPLADLPEEPNQTLKSFT